MAAMAVLAGLALPTRAADTLPPLSARPGDPARGAQLVADRQKSLCVLCHAGPFPNPHLQGTIAPDLAGVGSRLTIDQIRLRVVDMKRLNPTSIMPTYGEALPSDDDRRVAAQWRGKPVLAPADIEDIVVYLATLKE